MNALMPHASIYQRAAHRTRAIELYGAAYDGKCCSEALYAACGVYSHGMS